jgi:hypothetical protein
MKETYISKIPFSPLRKAFVRNLDLLVQTISMIGSPWGISEKVEGIHPIW